ncbi:MAG: transposase [Planctomycetota bacterium]|nr:transposase [Planctomycetota bacterium]
MQSMVPGLSPSPASSRPSLHDGARLPSLPPAAAALLTANHVAEEVCLPVAHRQVVLTIPKRLRLPTRDPDYRVPRRKLLGKLSACAWTCLQAEAVRLLGRRPSLRDGARVTPGMMAAIQTHGELLHWHPHIHVLVTCGVLTPEGDFLELPEFDWERLLQPVNSLAGTNSPRSLRNRRGKSFSLNSAML